MSEGQHQVVVTVTGPNGEVRTCEVTVNVRCPPCETDQVLLNTGYDHTAAGVYSIGAADAFWTVVADPDSNTTEPRPATVVSPYSGWQPALPDSRWITAYPTSRNDINGPYDFETTFCLADGWSDVQLKLCPRADDEAEVYLNDQLILTTPNPSFNTQNPECETIIDQNLFMAGPNILRVRVINTNSVAMGLNLAATITGAGLEDPRCCQPESSLSGQKFHDFHGTGVMDFGDPGLAGWTIELSDGNTTTTTVTDGNGFPEIVERCRSATAFGSDRGRNRARGHRPDSR